MKQSMIRKLFCIMLRVGNIYRYVLIFFKVNINSVSLLGFLPEIKLGQLRKKH